MCGGRLNPLYSQSQSQSQFQPKMRRDAGSAANRAREWRASRARPQNERLAAWMRCGSACGRAIRKTPESAGECCCFCLHLLLRASTCKGYFCWVVSMRLVHYHRPRPRTRLAVFAQNTFLFLLLLLLLLRLLLLEKPWPAITAADDDLLAKYFFSLFQMFQVENGRPVALVPSRQLPLSGPKTLDDAPVSPLFVLLPV